MTWPKTSDDMRASCHVQAKCLVDQARGDTAGTEHDVFELLRWRLGEMLFEAGLMYDCFHQDALDAMRAQLADQK